MNVHLIDSDPEDKHGDDGEDKNFKLEEPEFSPFELIPGLHQTKLREHYEKTIINLTE